MATEPTAEVVLPYAAPAIAGFTREEFDALIASGLIAEEGLIHGSGCTAHYFRSGLLAFRDRVRTDPTLAATVEFILDRPTMRRNADVVVLPHAACRILGYTMSEMVILGRRGIISHLVHRVRTDHYFLLAELVAFREAVRTVPALAARIEYELTKDQEN